MNPRFPVCLKPGRQGDVKSGLPFLFPLPHRLRCGFSTALMLGFVCWLLCGTFLVSCKKPAPPAKSPPASASPPGGFTPGAQEDKFWQAGVSGALPQGVYVWQREWNRRVSQSVRERVPAFDSAAVLVAQVDWPVGAGGGGNPATPTVARPPIDWAALRAAAKPVALVIRVHRSGPADQVAETVVRLFRERLDEARAGGLDAAGLQIDFDCPQKALGGYRQWLTAVRSALGPLNLPLWITTLPSWLGEPAFPALVDAADGYVLQVHSFDLTGSGKSPAVCDPVSARLWVAQAAGLGRPFRVALPTYRCLAGYAPDGRPLGVAADAGSPSWPPGTRILELESEPEALAALVAEWTQNRPAALLGLMWYRLPVEGEIRNWPWPTLAAVMAGRSPLTRLEAAASAGNPVDFTLRNTGEKDEPWPLRVTVTWTGPGRPAAADAGGGWNCQAGDGRIEFSRLTKGLPRRLGPGKSVPLGWLRWTETPAESPAFRFEIVR
jgi:hypothetical protein